MTLNDVWAKLRQYRKDNATEWNFKCNGIRDEETVALAVALRTNSTVEKVDLSYNGIGPEGAKALAKALRTNATLREVNLYNNGIGDEGTVALAVALRTNSTVQKVDLRTLQASSSTGLSPHDAFAHYAEWLALYERFKHDCSAVEDVLLFDCLVNFLWAEYTRIPAHLPFLCCFSPCQAVVSVHSPRVCQRAEMAWPPGKLLCKPRTAMTFDEFQANVA
eukprot:EG_transcript_27904